MKLLHGSTLPLAPEEIQELGRRIERGDFTSMGRGELAAWDPIPEYLDGLARSGGRVDGLRVVVDPGNGVAGLTGPAALSALGARVEVINGELAVEPSHPADPQHAENVEQLRRAARDSGAAIGFAWDGDGDRLGVVDGRGRRVDSGSGDGAAGAGASGAPAGGANSRGREDIAGGDRGHSGRMGGRRVLGPVGHSLAKWAMHAGGMDFGGEPSCHYYTRVARPAHITDDAVRAACRVAAICARGVGGRDGDAGAAAGCDSVLAGVAGGAVAVRGRAQVRGGGAGCGSVRAARSGTRDRRGAG